MCFVKETKITSEKNLDSLNLTHLPVYHSKLFIKSKSRNCGPLSSGLAKSLLPLLRQPRVKCFKEYLWIAGKLDVLFPSLRSKC